MKVIVIGGLSNGREIVKYLSENSKTELLKVYVINDELGKNISDFVTFDDIVPDKILCKIDHINKYEKEIIELKPDIIFVVGWSQLISKKIIDAARIGTIGFHPSKLPKDRGRSVLAWQISEGYKTGCVSMFWIDSGVDSGNIIGQKEFKINYNDSIRDVLDKVYNICINLTKTYYPLIMNGTLINIPQDINLATYRCKRTKKDGIIKWNSNSIDIYNLIRAITIPYPGAISFYNQKEIIVLEGIEIKDEKEYRNIEPGTIVSIQYKKGMLVKCKDNFILIKKVIIDNSEILSHELQGYFKIGDILGID